MLYSIYVVVSMRRYPERRPYIVLAFLSDPSSVPWLSFEVVLDSQFDLNELPRNHLCIVHGSIDP